VLDAALDTERVEVTVTVETCAIAAPAKLARTIGAFIAICRAEIAAMQGKAMARLKFRGCYLCFRDSQPWKCVKVGFMSLNLIFPSAAVTKEDIIGDARLQDCARISKIIDISKTYNLIVVGARPAEDARSMDPCTHGSTLYTFRPIGDAIRGSWQVLSRMIHEGIRRMTSLQDVSQIRMGHYLHFRLGGWVASQQEYSSTTVLQVDSKQIFVRQYGR